MFTCFSHFHVIQQSQGANSQVKLRRGLKNAFFHSMILNIGLHGQINTEMIMKNVLVVCVCDVCSLKETSTAPVNTAATLLLEISKILLVFWDDLKGTTRSV